VILIQKLSDDGPSGNSCRTAGLIGLPIQIRTLPIRQLSGFLGDFPNLGSTLQAAQRKLGCNLKPACGVAHRARVIAARRVAPMRTRGSILIEIVLWLCFLVPGLIYFIW